MQTNNDAKLITIKKDPHNDNDTINKSPQQQYTRLENERMKLYRGAKLITKKHRKAKPKLTKLKVLDLESPKGIFIHSFLFLFTLFINNTIESPPKPPNQKNGFKLQAQQDIELLHKLVNSQKQVIKL